MRGRPDRSSLVGRRWQPSLVPGPVTEYTRLQAELVLRIDVQMRVYIGLVEKGQVGRYSGTAEKGQRALPGVRESAGPFRDGGGQRVPPTNQPKQSKADRPTSSAHLAHSRRAIRAMPTPVEVSVFRRKLAGHACMCSVLLDGNAEMRSCAVRGLVAAVLMPRGAAPYGSMGTVGGPLGTVRAMQCGTAATTRRGGDSADRDSRACTRRSHTSSSLGSSS